MNISKNKSDFFKPGCFIFHNTILRRHFMVFKYKKRQLTHINKYNMKLKKVISDSISIVKN